MKITKAELREAVQRIVKAKLAEGVKEPPGDDGKLGKYATKYDKFLKDSLDEVNALIKEAEEMMTENMLQSPTVGERNRVLMARVGALKALKNNLSGLFSASHLQY